MVISFSLTSGAGGKSWLSARLVGISVLHSHAYSQFVLKVGPEFYIGSRRLASCAGDLRRIIAKSCSQYDEVVSFHQNCTLFESW